MTFHVPPKLKSVLWPHQRDALAAMTGYVASFQKQTPRAGLVHMPTGSGKTGIIACLARCLETKGPVLIVCPRAGIRDQLARDVEARFFEHANYDPAALSRRVVNFEDGSIDPGDLSDVVLVMTIQMLTTLRDDGRPLYRELQKRTALMLFDEGHYEPATVWSEVVRSVSCARIIFTATPFRDDFKLFDVDMAHIFSYTLAAAVRDRYIRSVQFHVRAPTTSPAVFAAGLLKDYDQLFKSPDEKLPSRPRVIVRCDTHEEIRQLQLALSNGGRSAIGIHENFKDDPVTREYHAVPEPAKVDATFWVHQFKLVEGIDDSRFQMLACFSEFRNVRQLVQQIGRVLRNPKQAKNAVAHVFDHSTAHDQEALYQSFARYDELVGKGDTAALALNSDALVTALRGAVPGLLYVDGRFRVPVDISQLKVASLQFPLSATVFVKPSGFSLKGLQAEIVAECLNQDVIPHELPIEDNTAAVAYVSIGNSRFLHDTYFPEPKLGFCVVHARGDYVFVFENQKAIAARLIKGGAVPLTQLRRLFSQKTGARLTSVSLLNANIGADQVRARSTAAVKVEQIAPAFDEHSYVLKTVTGYTVERRGTEDVQVRRYLGVDNSRISDATSKFVSFADWRAWIAEIDSTLQSSRASLHVFSRWATETGVPTNPEPRNILLDLGDVVERFKTVGDDRVAANQELDVSELCVDVQSGRFQVEANGEHVDVEIAFDRQRARYELKSRALDRGYYSPDDESEGIVRYLNRTQSFRVLPASGGYFYTLGRFCRPLIAFGPGYDDAKMGVLSSLVPSATLGATRSEKGDVCQAGHSGWESGCLFDVIDRLGAGTDLEKHLDATDVLVCDDLGEESADFVLVQRATSSRRKRVVFIHAKASSKGSKCSAAALQDVCGQAQKNLREASLFAERRRSKMTKWSGAWDGPAGTVGKRIRRVPKGLNVEEVIDRTIKDPSADREVWLFLGNLLSAKHLRDQLTKAKPTYHAIHVAYLLSSTISSVAAAGARLVVFCST